jgi:hypothetical protein
MKKILDYKNFITEGKGSEIILENVAQAKKLLKDTYILNKLMTKDSNYKTDKSGLIILDKDDVAVKLVDIPQEIKDDAKKNLKTIKLTEEEVKLIERDQKFLKIRELLGDKLGYSYMFLYFYIVEQIPFEELKTLLENLEDKKDLLSKTRRPIANYVDVNIPNNYENLIDDLEDLNRYKKSKKFIDEFTSDLKKDYASAAKYIKDNLVSIATAFDELGKENDGKINLEKQRATQKRFFDKIRRYKTVRELLVAAEVFLKSEANNNLSKFYDSIEKCNKKYGNYGVKVMYDEGGLIVLECLSYAACRELFSNTSWCIASSLSQWDNYVGGESLYNKQYMIMNFNLSPADNESAIGITIESTGKVRACHLKNDADAASTYLNIFAKFEKDLGLEKGFINSGLVPMSPADVDLKKRRNIANREVVKKGLTLEQIKKYIVEDGADVNIKNGEALDNAIQENDIEKAKLLLDYGASPNLRGRGDNSVNKTTSFEMLTLLIKYGAELTIHVLKPLVKDFDAVKFCLDNGLDPKSENDGLIRLVINSNNTEDVILKTIKLLQDHGSSLDSSRGLNLKNIIIKNLWVIADYYIENGYVDKYEEIFKWIPTYIGLSKEEKVRSLENLQKYLDAGKIKVSPNITRDMTYEDIVKSHGNLAKYFIEKIR